MLFFNKRRDVKQTTSKMFSHSEKSWKNMIQRQSFAEILQNRCSKNFPNFTGEHLCWGLFLKRLRVFSCEVCEISENTTFYRTPPVAASGDNKSHTRLFTLIKQTFSFHRVTFLKQPIIYGFIDDKNKEALIKKFFRLSLSEFKRLKRILRIVVA